MRITDIIRDRACTAEVWFVAAQGSLGIHSSPSRLEFQRNCLISHHKETFKRGGSLIKKDPAQRITIDCRAQRSPNGRRVGPMRDLFKASKWPQTPIEFAQ